MYFLLSLLSVISVCNNQEVWNDNNFQTNLNKYGSAFVKFYAPWCGHCKKLAPTWSELSQVSNFGTKVVKVDCTENGKKLCEKYEVRGYPTLKFIRASASEKDEVIDYDGERSLDALKSFVELHTQPEYRDVTSEDIAGYLIPDKKPNLIAFVSKADSIILAKIKEVSTHLKSSVTILFTTNSSAATISGQKADSLVLFRESYLQTKLEPAFVVFESLDDIVNQVLKSIHGSVGHRRVTNVNSFSFPMMVVYVDINPTFDPSRFKMIRNRLIKLSQRMKGFTISISLKQDFDNEIRELPMYTSPIFALILKEDHKRYLLEETFEIDKLNAFMESAEKFIANFQIGEIKVYIKSAPVPSKNDEPVKVVVGMTFEEIVLDESKDVLIELYAPWCGHCKKLEPIYSELAEKLKHNKDLIIAKMDATANDSPPEFPVRGFPTIFFSPKGKKTKPIPYNGDREVSAFISWLKSHSTSKITEVDEKSHDEL